MPTAGIAHIASAAIPAGSLFAVVLVCSLSVACFTFVMGNSFAAFPVIMAGIGVPLLIQPFGADPALLEAADAGLVLHHDLYELPALKTYTSGSVVLVGDAGFAPSLLAVPGIEWWCIDMCFWAGSWELVESSRAFVLDLLRSAAAA